MVRVRRLLPVAVPVVALGAASLVAWLGGSGDTTGTATLRLPDANGDKVAQQVELRGSFESAGPYEPGGLRAIATRLTELVPAGSPIVGVSVSSRGVAVSAVQDARTALAYVWQAGRMAGPYSGASPAQFTSPRMAIDLATVDLDQVLRLRADPTTTEPEYQLRRNPARKYRLEWWGAGPRGTRFVAVGASRASGG